MPIPGKTLAFVYAVKAGPVAKELSEAFPSIWNKDLRLAATENRSRGPQHRPGVDLHGIRGAVEEALKVKPPQIRSAVLIVIDMRDDDAKQLTEDFAYRLPLVEVVPVKSKGNVAERVREQLEYFGVLKCHWPENVRDALGRWAKRFPEITLLPRALRSADDAADFEEPRLLLGSLHALKRVEIDWQIAKRKDNNRAVHRVLHMNTRDALNELIEDARFGVSDAADRAAKSRSWKCEDDVTRYFGWHLKWSLRSIRSIENHCRVHWATQQFSKPVRVDLYIGHCGEHLD
ncbi:MAG: hypothetical protein IT358_04225 [Gemmatimonadaceae bacterium]|jgi:hypothetical protein|nr:hypothetical protein [Gemmatimonadaceae bacterium]